MWEGGNITTNDRIEINYTDLTINQLKACRGQIDKFEVKLEARTSLEAT